MKDNSIFKMVLCLVVIAVAVSCLLSVVNNVTAPLIKQNSVKKLDKSLASVIDADKFNAISNEGDTVVYEALKDGEKVGFAVENHEKGYGGDITVLTGISNDMKVCGVEILSMSETAGLGANASNESFRNQYKGKTGDISVVKNSPKDNEIEAISGATVTSSAVTRAVNAAIKTAKEVK